MKIIESVESLIMRYFFVSGRLKAIEAMLAKSEKDVSYWHGRADFWRGEFDKCYNQLQKERKEKK